MVRLQATLYYLATGCSMRTLSDVMHIPKSTLLTLVDDVIKALVKLHSEFINFPNDEAGFKKNASWISSCGGLSEMCWINGWMSSSNPLSR